MKLPTDPARNLAALIRCPSVTPAEGGALRTLEDMLQPLGFSVDRPLLSESGEPDNPDALGDMIKIGRRGSLSGSVIVNGRQGHAAYPQLADNPVRGLISLVDALLHPVFDKGTKDFQPTNLEVTSIDVGNPAT